VTDQAGRGELGGLLGQVSVGEHANPQAARRDAVQRGGGVVEGRPSGLVPRQVLREYRVQVLGSDRDAQRSEEIAGPAPALFLEADLPCSPGGVMLLLKLEPARDGRFYVSLSNPIGRQPRADRRGAGRVMIKEGPVQVEQHRRQIHRNQGRSRFTAIPGDRSPGCKILRTICLAEDAAGALCLVLRFVGADGVRRSRG
jgi:hypothetical protein